MNLETLRNDEVLTGRNSTSVRQARSPSLSCESLFFSRSPTCIDSFLYTLRPCSTLLLCSWYIWLQRVLQ